MKGVDHIFRKTRLSSKENPIIMHPNLALFGSF